MRSFLAVTGVALLAAALAGVWAPSEAQFGSLKDAAKKKAEEKLKKAAQKPAVTPDTTAAAAPDEEAPAATEAPAGAPEAQAGAAASEAPAGSSEDMTLYTKYDFIPGDRVIFYDDLSREEMGEFPSRWSLERGVFEIVKQYGQNWIWCSDQGTIYPKVAQGPLPEKYTVELEFYANQKDDGWLYLLWFDAAGEQAGELVLSYDKQTELRILGKTLAEKTINRLPVGKHVLRVMATKTTLKCYLDQERIANVPAIEGFAPVRLGVRIDPYFSDHDPSLIGAFRFAEGGKTLRQQLEETGKIVTHGILFDSGSSRIKAESYKTLADIGALLGEDAALRVSIEGHTDADGADDSNVKLSDERAAAVKKYLVDAYKIDAGRLESKGWGEAAPIDTNDTPEGKANNRRVELVKLSG